MALRVLLTTVFRHPVIITGTVYIFDLSFLCRCTERGTGWGGTEVPCEKLWPEEGRGKIYGIYAYIDIQVIYIFARGHLYVHTAKLWPVEGRGKTGNQLLKNRDLISRRPPQHQAGPLGRDLKLISYSTFLILIAIFISAWIANIDHQN